MYDPSWSIIIYDPRMPYYTELEISTAKYEAIIAMSRSYGHNYPNVTAIELVYWDNVVTKAGYKVVLLVIFIEHVTLMMI